jgi:hypothetical protein
MTDTARRLLAADRARDEFDAEPSLAAADRLVAAWRQICAADAGADHRNELGNALLDRYDLSDDASDALAAAACYEEAVARVDPPDAGYLNNLGLALRLSYLDTDEEALLDRSVEALGQAITAADPDDLPVAVDNLERSLDLLDFARHDPARLDRAVDGRRRIVMLVDADADQRARRHAGLGAALHRRWAVNGERIDLDHASDAYAVLAQYLHQQAVLDKECQPLANDLGVHHYHRYRALRHRTDLDSAVEWSRRAAAGGDHLARANLGRALRVRHDATGAAGDLDEAIELLRDLPTDVVVPLDLANALLTRFEVRGDLADLTAAIDTFTKTADSLPIGHPDRAAAHNDMANALRVRFLHGRDAADLAGTRAALGTALEITCPAEPDRYLQLDNLANAMVDEFTLSGDTRWLADALRLYDEALAVLADPPQERRRVLGNRAGVLWYLWEANGDRADLDRAVTAFEKAAEGTPPGESGRAMRFNNLAVAVIAAQPDPLDPRAETRIRDAFAEATAGGDALWTVRAAREWGRWAATRGAWAEAATAYCQAQAALGDLFQLQHERRDKERWLREASGIAIEAGSAFRATKRPREAVGRLEAGRGLLLSQALSTPGRDLARLTRSGRDDLAGRYERAVAVVAAHEGPRPGSTCYPVQEGTGMTGDGEWITQFDAVVKRWVNDGGALPERFARQRRWVADRCRREAESTGDPLMMQRCQHLSSRLWAGPPPVLRLAAKAYVAVVSSVEYGARGRQALDEGIDLCQRVVREVREVSVELARDFTELAALRAQTMRHLVGMLLVRYHQSLEQRRYGPGEAFVRRLEQVSNQIDNLLDELLTIDGDHPETLTLFGWARTYPGSAVRSHTCAGI